MSEQRPDSEGIDSRTRQAIENLEYIPEMIADARHTGIHTSREHGGNVEFAEHRPYEPGDDLRHLDWNALAKSDQLVLKQYESETQISGELILDASGSMDFGSGEYTKWQTARALSALVASILVQQKDRIRYHLSNENKRMGDWLSTFTGLTEYFPLLENVDADGETALVSDTTSLPTGNRSLWIMISDFWIQERDPLLRWFRGIKQKGHDLLLLPVWDPMERNFEEDETVKLRDVETGETIVIGPTDHDSFSEALEKNRTQFQQLARSAGATVWPFFTDGSLFSRFRHYLRKQNY